MSISREIEVSVVTDPLFSVVIADTGSEDEAMDMSEDDFFIAGSSSDDADADDEWTDKSPR